MSAEQCFSAFLTRAFKTAPQAVGLPTLKSFSLLLQNCNFATVRNRNVNLCFPLFLGGPSVRVIHNSQGENRRSRGSLRAITQKAAALKAAPLEGRLVSHSRTNHIWIFNGQHCRAGMSLSIDVWPTNRAVPGLGTVRVSGLEGW